MRKEEVMGGEKPVDVRSHFRRDNIPYEISNTKYPLSLNHRFHPR
jgi:hypothetical protein